MSYGAWLVILHAEQSSGGREKPQGLHSHGHRAAHPPGRLHQGSAQAPQYHSPTPHLQITCLTFLSYSTATLCACSGCQQSCIFPQCLTLTSAWLCWVLTPGKGWCLAAAVFAGKRGSSCSEAWPNHTTVSRPFPAAPVRAGALPETSPYLPAVTHQLSAHTICF